MYHVAGSHIAIQHLAAKAAVRELEMTASLPGAYSPPQEVMNPTIRQNTERLGQIYSIISRWSSFVAVKPQKTEPSKDTSKAALYKAPMRDLDLLARPRDRNLLALSGYPPPLYHHQGVLDQDTTGTDSYYTSSQSNYYVPRHQSSNWQELSIACPDGASSHEFSFCPNSPSSPCFERAPCHDSASSSCASSVVCSPDCCDT